ncbi:hypothetical protein J3459_002466 [Metarhizium acridum]|uniref:uncharacterized protein n=1 Tax=Metarhizium acridum TaxID=92637 RepID=UPI001C6C0B2E|nr:hypothetical protein J3458_001376 [Metarhizium acridum]KAG8428729.1 hypothetical protein J3459_002466 [Metarhizium acridum]
MENEEDKKWVIGIDLGTANISVAVYREATRQIETILLDDGYCLPAYIGFNESEPFIGSEAL